jgi:hypothetical protein
MISTALTTLAVSLVTFFLLTIFTQQERRRGRRFFAARARAWLDRVVDDISQSVSKKIEHFTKYMVQLSWYYGLHSLLRGLLKGMIAMYTYFEDLFERNRARTKQLRAEKRQLSKHNHLQQIANHREETALSASEQQKLKKQKLEGNE